jgi:hypothetical protein
MYGEGGTLNCAGIGQYRYRSMLDGGIELIGLGVVGRCITGMIVALIVYLYLNLYISVCSYLYNIVSASVYNCVYIVVKMLGCQRSPIRLR